MYVIVIFNTYMHTRTPHTSHAHEHTCRAERYQKFHITITMTVNIPIINIIAISAELTVTALQALKL